MSSRAFHGFTASVPAWLAQADPAWVVRNDKRYEDLLEAFWSAFIFGACVAYEVRRRRELRLGSEPTAPKRWRDRRELRAVLYSFAGLLMVTIPLTVYR